MMTFNEIIAAAYTDPPDIDRGSLYLRIGFLAGTIMRMEGYMRHTESCDASVLPCSCGLDKLLNDLESTDDKKSPPVK